MLSTKTIFFFIAMLTTTLTAMAQDSTAQKRLTGFVMTEVNHGYRHENEHPSVVDFPHIQGSATLSIGRGWTVVAEVEYERLRYDGEWDNNFRGNYTTNKLYVSKHYSEELNFKAGIIDIPVGTTNSGGPALTIYDPLSESTLMPMTWHEGGAALWGRHGITHYEVGGYVYSALPLKRSRLLGFATRLGIEPLDGLDLSASFFYGSNREGMVQRWNPNLVEYDHLYHAAFDFAYLAHGWTIDGQMLASNAHGYKAAGIEVGYDIAQMTGLQNFSIIPFTRYDGIFHVEGVSANKWTFGLNTCLPLGFTFKAEGAWKNPSNDKHSTMGDISIGWQKNF